MLASPALFARPARTICLTSGPVDNIAETSPEGAPEIELKLAAGFTSVQLLNNSRQEVMFEAKFYQIDGPGSFEDPPGDWPKPKVERFYGKRPSVPPESAHMLTSDWTDDPEPIYAYEAQVKITSLGTRGIRREEVLLMANGRSADILKIAPEQRILNQEWTEIRCTW
jgi:hypothetical protein